MRVFLFQDDVKTDLLHARLLRITAISSLSKEIAKELVTHVEQVSSYRTSSIVDDCYPAAGTENIAQ